MNICALILLLAADTIGVTYPKRMMPSKQTVWSPATTNVMHATLYYGNSFIAGLILTSNTGTLGQDPVSPYNGTNFGAKLWAGGTGQATTNVLLDSQVLNRNGYDVVLAPIGFTKYGSNNYIAVRSGWPGYQSGDLLPGSNAWNSMVADVAAANQAANANFTYDGAMLWVFENDRSNVTLTATVASNNLNLITSSLSSVLGITNGSIGLINTNIVGTQIMQIWSGTVAFCNSHTAWKTNDANGLTLFWRDNLHQTWTNYAGLPASLPTEATNFGKAIGYLP